MISQKDIIINNLQNELNGYKIDNVELLQEIAILFPELKNTSIGKQISIPYTDTSNIKTIILYQIQDKNVKVDTKKIERWLHEKMKSNLIELHQIE